MSNSLRDMFVGIQFDDGATKTIDQIDRKMDELERGFIKFGTKVDKSGQGLRTLGTTGVKATSDVSSGLKKAGSEGEKATTKIEKGFDKSEKEAKGFTREVNNSGNALSGLKSTAMKIAGVIGGIFAVDKIKNFAIDAIGLTANKQALDSQFQQVFGLMDLTAQARLNNIADQTSIVSDRLKGSFTQIAAFAKTTGADEAAALSLAERATLSAADSAAFYDRSIEDVTESLQSFLKGNYENDAALGISATETTRNAKATELYGKKFKDLSEAQKQLTLMAMVEDGNKLSGALGQAAREADGMENVTGNLKTTWDKLKASMAKPFLGTVTSGLQDLTAKLQGVNAEELGMKMKDGFESTMDVVVPTFNTIKDGIGWVMENKEPLIAGLAGITAGFVALKVISTVNGLMAVYRGSALASMVATQGLNAALRANPIGLVVTAIGLLVAGGVALYRNWDAVKLKAGELWSTTTEKFAGIKQSVSNFVQPAISWFDSLSTKWNNFKSAISNFKVPEWMSKVGGAISSGINKVKSLAGADGSHATGLASVPFDNYRANLHQGESVLTADQSSTLRGLGVLSSNSDGTPNVDTTPLVSPVTVSTPVGANGSGNNIQISAPIELNIQGNADDAAIQKLLSILPAEVKRIFEEIFRQKLAGIGG